MVGTDSNATHNINNIAGFIGRLRGDWRTRTRPDARHNTYDIVTIIIIIIFNARESNVQTTLLHNTLFIFRRFFIYYCRAHLRNTVFFAR